MNILVSACLLGIPCRYDGTGCAVADTIASLLSGHHLIPVCPEQLGGLPTPRDPVELRGGRALTKAGLDVTEAFTKGAAQACSLARLFQCSHAILKEKSPSCGSGYVYDGTFSGAVVQGMGLAAALLRQNGVTVVNEGDAAQLLGITE